MSQKLEQLYFESKQEVYRVTKHDEAQLPKVPVDNERGQYTAEEPVGILFVIIGRSLMLEIQASLVGDPDETETSTRP